MGIQVQTDNPMYVRDIHSKALLNTDYTELQQHRREKAYFLKQESDINILRTQVDELTGIREEMLEIKGLLREIIKK